MAEIRPFCAIRPVEGLVSRIAALPYDVYSRAEAKKEVEREPLSFLGIDRAETQFSDEVAVNAPEVYERAHDLLWERIEEGQFVQETQPCYYVYELTMDKRVQTGIVGCASVDDYDHNVIKKHENTRADKEEDRVNHVDCCEAQTGPIFLAYRANQVINDVVVRAKEQKSLYDFVSPDGIRHRVFRISENEDIEKIKKAFTSMNDIYIADGHHRCASAVRVSKMRREVNPSYTGEEEFNFFLSVLFPDDQLMILDYNRVVKDLNGYEKADFIKAVEEKFDVKCVGREAYRPGEKGTFGMYMDSEWYSLRAKPDICSTDPVEGLDVSLLQKHLLEPILGIKDPKTDKRIDFVGGIRGLCELERRVHSDCKVAFSMYPTSIGELFSVADAGRLMPPKSTWFEPKLRSGIFIHSIR